MDFKKLLTLGSAAVGIFVIFLGVGYIIQEPPGANDGKEQMDLSFLRTIRPSELNERERQKPKTPPKAEKQPDIPKPKIAKIDQPKAENLKMEAQPLNVDGLDTGSGPFVGGVGAAMAASGSDSDLIPIVKVNPPYPRSAAMKGLEGYVNLIVDINTDGSVTNPRVIESSPRRVFDRSAVSAALKYKYKPPMKDGKPYAVKDHGLRIDFVLGQ